MDHNKYLIVLITIIGLHLCQSSTAQTITYVQKDAVLTSGVTDDTQVNSLGIGSVLTSRTYIDGLGRPVQTVASKASPNSNKDIVQVVGYNDIGQQPHIYLPYVDNTGNYATGAYRPTGITDQANYFNNNSNTSKVASDQYPYSEKIFENSPLRRLLNERDIGSAFRTGEHLKSYNYRSNNNTDNVLMWGTDGTYQNQFYPVNTLAVTSTVKADGLTTNITFTDNRGNVVLKRKVLSSAANLDTYFIYNNLGNLSYVIQPKAVALMIASSNYTLAQSGVKNLIFSFVYDNMGRLIQKNIPGGSPIYFIYDPYNRPVLIQDGNLRPLNQWYYIKYDVKNRPISQGIYTDANAAHLGGINGGMQTFVTNLPGYAATSFERRTGTTTSFYTNSCFPTVNYDNSPLQDLAYAYFDDYNLTQTANPDFQYQYQSLPGEPSSNAATSLVRGLQTIVRQRTVGQGLNNIWLINVFFYDRRGNIIQTQSNNHLGSASGGNIVTDFKTVIVDFTGKPLVNLINKAAGAAGSTKVKTTFTYDAHNTRLQFVDQVYNNQSVVRIASYEYNEVGQLVKKNLGLTNSQGSSIPSNIAWGPVNSVSPTSTTTIVASNSITFTPTATAGFVIPAGAVFNAYISTGALQSIDYRYNIRGQLTSINNSKLSNDGGVTNNDANDLFGMQIMYDQPDAALNSSIVTTTPSYSGKISAIKWMTVNSSLSKTNERSYVYTYDHAGRLTTANYAERLASSSGTASFTINQGGFDEAGLTYDENGNILTLNRNSSSIGASGNTQVDNLIYTYDSANPNQLSKINDGDNSTQYTSYGFQNLTGAAASSNYSYSANGSLMGDPYKGLSIGYNVLNKTDNIQITTGPNGAAISGRYITYTYDASGTIIRKQQYDQGGMPKNTTDYIDGFAYINGALSYFSMPEGRVVNSGGTLSPEYIITDQQGNARFSFRDNGSGQPKVIQENSYYPFGLTMANSPITMPTIPNNKLYNGGSEWQNDYNNLPNYYETFYRNYDPGIGRFVTVDPMAESSFSRSTYHYAKNNPLKFNDPLGNDPGDGGPGGDIYEPNVVPFYSYDGYDAQAESEGSSAAGTNEGGNMPGAGVDNSILLGNTGYDFMRGLDGNWVTTYNGLKGNTYTQQVILSQAVSEDGIYSFISIGSEGMDVSASSIKTEQLSSTNQPTLDGMSSLGGRENPFDLIGGSVSTVKTATAVYNTVGSTIVNKHYKGTVRESNERLFYSDTQVEVGKLKAASRAFGLNMVVAKLGWDCKDGGGSVNVKVGQISMYLGWGNDGILFGSSYSHDGQVVGDDWAIRASDNQKASWQNFFNWMGTTFPVNSNPGVGASPGIHTVINGLKFSL